MSILTLREEIGTDPLGRGYSGMTDGEIAQDLNTVYRTRNITAMSATEVFQNIYDADFQGLTEAKESHLYGLLGMGTLNPWGQEVQAFVKIFGGGSQTLSNLAAARVENVSRATELGIGHVDVGMVKTARYES